jgi:predicted metal-dependent hydrolase
MIKSKESNHQICVDGIDVQVVRKDIKNLHLAVYPPDGQVRVAVPYHVNDDNVRLAVVSKLSWIKRQQRELREQPRQTQRSFISGECHFYFGKRCRLEVIEGPGKHEVKFLQSGKLKMFVRKGTEVSGKERLLNEWYRRELKKCVPELIDKWHPIVGKKISGFGIKRMKTKWGSCNIDKKFVWLNLELAKKSPRCLEYILVHELVHLHERHHNEHFKDLMDRFLPNWRESREVLKRAPLGNEDWVY